jgi:glycosyltransferase involved in cell wall biosynthesis
MHIGIDARLPYFRSGGISEYTRNLVAALAGLVDGRSGTRVTVLHAKADRASYIPPGAAAFARFDVETPCHHPWERLLLAAEIRALSLDVLHSPDFIPPAAGARRRVVTVHDVSFLDHPEHLTAEARRHYAGQIAWALESADAAVTHTEHVRARLVDRFRLPPDKVSVVPCAAAARFSEAVPGDEIDRTLARYGLDRGYVLHVGVIEPRKNLAMLIDAHDRLRAEKGCAVPLVLAGPEGWLCGNIADAARARPGTVLRTGPVPDRDLVCLYMAAGVLALPSVHEGLGLPMLEAMSAGCPVVASTGGALPEVAGGAALLVDPDRPDRWADALASVLGDHSAANALRTRGRTRASALSWPRTASAMLTLYERAVSSSSSAPRLSAP